MEPSDQGGEVLQDEVIQKIAEVHSKTPAQVVLRWHLQNNTIVIPKSVTPSRMKKTLTCLILNSLPMIWQRLMKLNSNRRKGPHPSDMNVR